ncbi:BZ3500_MvSof-1268-A1-R1_Chr6-3g08919 [Microbotryum saponariae]|uniref:BZ3500_MvSof-1268-A1-R1_Chr6-3g08919 protein n=1 Tax=Microbotryum saponariae TaxID=289078 RepID=A0A2X0KK11_9BASI|nr:BZ3500_MvSof-1268-A1-R1_Chr6-3g08919 [Microbotryum saponariae]SDA07521.1 BZ3501_MvSof-1269-A2-R1_Chr6-2g08623 [Microbotryum saponariae]
MLGRYTRRCASSQNRGKNSSELIAIELGQEDALSGSLTYKKDFGVLHYPATRASTPEHGQKSAGKRQSSVPDQPHPIHHLMQRAEQEWNEKVARQSRSFAEAIAKYHHRYDQPPPKGFEVWYAFAVENNVQMIDEYDSIYEKILPFAAIPQHVLKARADMSQNREEFWLQHHGITINIENMGKNVTARGPMMESSKHRVDEVMKLIKDIVPLLPRDVNFTFTGHDIPWIVVGGEQKQKHIAAAIEKRYFGDDRRRGGWASMCPPGSPLRRATPFDARMEWKPPSGLTLIENHIDSMDVCHHPENQGLHGFTAWDGPRPALFFPMFSFTSSHLHNDLLLPALEQYGRPVGPDPIWSKKKKNELCGEVGRTNENITVAVSVSVDDKPNQPGNLTLHSAPASSWAKHYFDFQFSGCAQQCGTQAMCRSFEAEHRWDAYMSEAQQNEYKYVLDVDGNGWSGRFHRLMASNSLVLKSTIFPEWYAERIQPWYHYVPVNVDHQDLYSIMAFFKGDLEGKGGHDVSTEQIAMQGKEWTEGHWRWVDMQACEQFRCCRLAPRSAASESSTEHDTDVLLVQYRAMERPERLP